MGDLGHGMFEAGRARLRAALSRLIRTGHKQGRNPRNPHFLRIRVFHFTALTTSLFLASFFGLLSVKVYTDYDAELSRSERTADNLAAMNAAQLESTFNNVETLLTLLDEASISVGTIALQNLARAIEQKSASVHRIIIVDTYGAPVDRTGLAVTTSEAAALNLAATSNWGRFANKAGPVFPAHGPVDQVENNEGYFSLSHPLANYDGEERWAVALISAKKLPQLIAMDGTRLQLGGEGLVALIGTAGKTQALTPAILSEAQQTTLDRAVNPLAVNNNLNVGYIDTNDGDILFGRRHLSSGTDLVILLPWNKATPNLRDSALLLIGFSTSATLFALAFASFMTRQVHRTEETDELLLQSEKLFDLAASSAKCGIWSWNINSQNMTWSSSIMKLLGFDSGGAELTFNQALGLVHPTDRKYLRRVEKSMRSGQSEFDTKFRLKHADGHFLWMRARGEVRSNRNVTKHGESEERVFYGIIIDMTDELMAAAREEQARVTLRNAVENISDSFALWDRNREIILSNSRFDNIAPFSVEESWQALDEDLESEQENGRWLQIKSNRISGGAVVTIARDITDLKLKNAALEESRTALGETVTDLKTSRSHLKVLAEKFEEEKRRAEEANRSKTEFLANMSHELRTPLNAIIGFSEIMETGMFGPMGDERYEEYATDIRKSGRSLLELIDDILDMSRIESGKYDVDCQPLQTDLMVEDCIRLVEARAEEKNIDLTNAADLTPKIFADKGAYKHILVNVLSNAVKFTGENGAIRVSSTADLKFVTVTVTDTGVGIEKKNLKKLGMPFVQFEKHSEKRFRGSGLGLAISMSLVEMMSGSISVESEPGKGTKVSITLPRRELDVA